MPGRPSARTHRLRRTHFGDAPARDERDRPTPRELVARAQARLALDLQGGRVAGAVFWLGALRSLDRPDVVERIAPAELSDTTRAALLELDHVDRADLVADMYRLADLIAGLE